MIFSVFKGFGEQKIVIFYVSNPLDGVKIVIGKPSNPLRGLKITIVGVSNPFGGQKIAIFKDCSGNDARNHLVLRPASIRRKMKSRMVKPHNDEPP